MTSCNKHNFSWQKGIQHFSIQKAIIAIARMLLTAIYSILMKNEPYNADLCRQSDTPPKHRAASVEEAIFILQRQGCLVTPAT